MFQTKGAAVSSANCVEKSSYPLVLLSLQSPSVLICTVKNMYEYVCTYLSMSADFQKIFLLKTRIAPLCKGMTLFTSERSAVLFAFFILFKITHWFPVLFSTIASNSGPLFCKLSPLSHHIIFLTKLLCSPTLKKILFLLNQALQQSFSYFRCSDP